MNIRSLFGEVIFKDGKSQQPTSEQWKLNKYIPKIKRKFVMVWRIVLTEDENMHRIIFKRKNKFPVPNRPETFDSPLNLS